MKYSILNFKLFIYLLICKMWSSSMHLWLWLWIKDILLYSKWVLNIKFLFCLKVILRSKFENAIHDLPPRLGPLPLFLLTLNGSQCCINTSQKSGNYPHPLTPPLLRPLEILFLSLPSFPLLHPLEILFLSLPSFPLKILFLSLPSFSPSS